MSLQDTETPMEPDSGDTASERAARAADRARIAAIEAQILDLERLLISLKEERSSLQDRLGAYTYPVLTLPNEIVSEIFIQFLPLYPKRPQPIGLLSPYLLCRICRQWRDIALATPKLWRAISLSLGKVGRLPQKLHYLNTSLALSGSCLVSIQLESRSAAHSANDQFRQTIADHCARLEYLELYFHGSDILPDFEHPLPFLRGLKLGWAVETLATTPLAVPSLQKLLLGVYRDRYGPIFPWSQLTVVSMDQIHLYQYSYLITQLVCVVYCRFNIYPGGELSLQDITLPHLETLILVDWLFEDPVASGILDRLTLPALQRLQIRETFLARDDPVSSIVSLVTRSKCNLQELSAPGATVVRQNYHAAFPSASIMFHRQLHITEAFLNDSDSEDGEDTESLDYIYSDSEEEWGAISDEESVVLF